MGTRYTTETAKRSLMHAQEAFDRALVNRDLRRALYRQRKLHKAAVRLGERLSQEPFT